MAVSHISHSVISVSSPGQIDPEDIFSKIDEKVDKNEYLSEISEKCETWKVRNLCKFVETGNKQTRTLAVLLTTLIKCFLEMPKESSEN
jgi:hypothetical protein